MRIPHSMSQLIGRDRSTATRPTPRDSAGPVGMYASVLGKELGTAIDKRRPHAGSRGSAVRDALPGPAALPTVEHRVRLASSANEAFCAVVGSRPGEAAHGGYLHAVTFPLSTELMTTKSFPLRLMGLIHLKNSVIQHRAVMLDTTVKIRVRVQEFGKHRRGTTVTILAEIWDETGELAYTDESLYLAKEAAPSTREEPGGNGSDKDSTSGSRPDPRDGYTLIGIWRLPASTGRSYAKVSGDANPIHLSNATAKLFGMKAAIAHGMYCASRALSQAAPDPSAPCAWEVSFGSPVFLPTNLGIWRNLSGGFSRDTAELRGIGAKNRKSFDFSWRRGETR